MLIDSVYLCEPVFREINMLDKIHSDHHTSIIAIVIFFVVVVLPYIYSN